MASTKRGADKPKFSPEDVKRHQKAIKDEIEKRKKEHKGENFQGISPEEIEKKLSSIDSPFIFFMGWSQTTPGGTLSISMGVFNPDPVAVNSLYVHGWVGPANPVPNTDLGGYFVNVDERFPRLTQPPPFGLTLNPSTSSPTLVYSVAIPTTIQKSNYIWNFALLRMVGFGVGQLVDRSVLVFAVV
jgi:hypothetical protein